MATKKDEIAMTTKEFEVNFKEVILRELDERKMTVNQLSRETGQSRDALYRYLKGLTKAIHSSTIESVLEYFKYNFK